MVFHELLHLDHYLMGREDLQAVLKGVQEVKPSLHVATLKSREYQVPAELDWFLKKGLEQAPADRYASVDEMTEELQRIIRGECRVLCQRTFIKRMLGEASRATDAHPIPLIVGAALLMSLLGAAVVKSIMGFM